jgi:hypothetical protein
MAVWDELKVVLARLRDQQPDTLTQWPMLDVDEGTQPPFTIRLAPWATATAEELHRQFGADIELTVGALPYPLGRKPTQPLAASPPAGLLDPHETAVRLDGPAVVSSGHTLQHGLLLQNLTGRELQIATNGQVTAVVVDPHTGEVVGGYAGFQQLPLIIFRVAPGQTERVPLLIGTASCTPRLGYTIPPGDWGIQAGLKFVPPHDAEGHPSPRDAHRRAIRAIVSRPGRDLPRRRTPILPLTITA